MRALRPGYWLLASLLLAGVCALLPSRRDTYAIPDEPEQETLVDDQTGQSMADEISVTGARLTPVATFDVVARVLGAERYRYDQLSSVIPVDLAAGWGIMSDTSVTNRMNISQSMRFYYVSGPRDLPWEEIFVSSSNMHLIPSSKKVRSRVLSLRKGQTVHLWGTLVNVRIAGGGSLRTSTVRTDRGAGACEIIYVDSLVILPHRG